MPLATSRRASLPQRSGCSGCRRAETLTRDRDAAHSTHRDAEASHAAARALRTAQELRVRSRAALADSSPRSGIGWIGKCFPARSRPRRFARRSRPRSVPRPMRPLRPTPPGSAPSVGRATAGADACPSPMPRSSPTCRSAHRRPRGLGRRRGASGARPHRHQGVSPRRRPRACRRVRAGARPF